MQRAAFALFIVAAVLGGGAAAIVACSGPACAPGTLLLHVGLLDESPAADTIRVQGNDPGALFDESFAHPVDPAAVAAMIEHVDEVVTFPGGYPKYATLHLVVRALQGGVVIGENTTTVRVGESCGESSLLVSARSGTDDDAGANGGF